MIRAPRSLQNRLLLLVLSGVALVWLVTSVLTWFDVRHELDELLDGHLAQAAALLVVQQAQEMEEDDGQGLDAPTLHRYAPKVAFQVFHEDRLALRSANAPVAPMVEAGQKFTSGFRTVQMDGMDWRVFAAHGAKRDVQVYVGEQVGIAGLHFVGGAAQHPVADGGGAAAAGAGGVVGGAPGRAADSPARARTGRAPAAGAESGRHRPFA